MTKPKYSFVTGTCRFFHRWETIIDTGDVLYARCKDCTSRFAKQYDGKSNKIDPQWTLGTLTDTALIASVTKTRLANPLGKLGETLDDSEKPI